MNFCTVSLFKRDIGVLGMGLGLFSLSCSSVKDSIQDTAIEDVVEYPSLPELDETITSIMSEDGIPGVSSCIIKAGEVAWCNGYGYANIETELKVTPNTPFMLASVSKTITGVAVMHIVETGSIGLDDPINEHLQFEVHQLQMSSR